MAEALLNKRTIMVAVDNSDASEKAVQWTVDNLLREGDDLRLLHVIPLATPLGMPLVLDMSMPAFPLEPDPQEDAQHVAKAREFIRQRFTRKLDAANVPYQVQLVHFLTDNESIGQAICQRAEALNAAAVVMNKHQRGRISEFFLGSACKYCSLHCKQPLVVLHD